MVETSALQLKICRSKESSCPCKLITPPKGRVVVPWAPSTRDKLLSTYWRDPRWAMSSRCMGHSMRSRTCLREEIRSKFRHSSNKRQLRFKRLRISLPKHQIRIKWISKMRPNPQNNSYIRHQSRCRFSKQLKSRKRRHLRVTWVNLSKS